MVSDMHSLVIVAKGCYVGESHVACQFSLGVEVQVNLSMSSSERFLFVFLFCLSVYLFVCLSTETIENERKKQWKLEHQENPVDSEFLKVPHNYESWRQKFLSWARLKPAFHFQRWWLVGTADMLILKPCITPFYYSFYLQVIHGWNEKALSTCTTYKLNVGGMKQPLIL